MNNLKKIFDFLHLVSDFKSTLRYTTLPSGRRESSAEHSWRLALMSFMIAEELKLDIDTLHAVKIALVHGIAEAITGDYDSYKVATGELSKTEKEKAEKEAVGLLSSKLPKQLGLEIKELWQEYEANQTKEANYIKALDKIETLTQFIESGHSIYNDALDHIGTYADKHVERFSELKDILKITKRELKAEFEKGNLLWKPEYDKV